MEQIPIDNHLYERVYEEIIDYGRAEFNHCPGIRLYPHYKNYLKGNIIDLGSGTGETVIFLREQNINACGIDWIEPRSEFCLKKDISILTDLQQYDCATCFDVIEHLNNKQAITLFTNMTDCKYQIFTIANNPSIITLNSGEKIDLHINKKPFKVWRPIISDYFDILKELPVRNYHHLYICQQKQDSKEYIKYIIDFLKQKEYVVEEKNEKT